MRRIYPQPELGFRVIQLGGDEGRGLGLGFGLGFEGKVFGGFGVGFKAWLLL